MSGGKWEQNKTAVKRSAPYSILVIHYIALQSRSLSVDLKKLQPAGGGRRGFKTSRDSIRDRLQG